MSLLWDEWRKITQHGKAMLILSVAMIAQIVLPRLLPDLTELPYSDTLYRKFTAEYGGAYSAEISENINNHLQEIQTICAEYGSVQQAYLDGTLTLEQFKTATDAYGIAQAELSTMQYLSEKCAYLDGAEDFAKSIFYDTNIKRFLDDTGYPFLLVLALLCVIVPIFDREYRSGIYRLILTTPNGHIRVALYKLIPAFLLAFSTSLLFSGIQSAIYLAQAGTEHLHQPLSNLMDYPDYGQTTVLQFYLTDVLYKACCMGCGCLAVCIVTMLCRETTISLFFSAAVLMLPALSADLLPQNVGRYLFCGMGLTALYPANCNIPLLFLILLMKTTVYTLVGIRLWCRN
ncbi:MAG: hypothetical protein E7503_04910 [Ruminococcus sp.]|nr:hypothetical protein [Ruminococcus sp.]